MENTERIQYLFNESKKIKIEDLQETLNELINVHSFIIQKLHELQPELLEGEVYIETLIQKMIFASKSALLLTKPQKLEIYNSEVKIDVIDTPSIFILTRSIIECFITLEYLYFDTAEKVEKEFRYKLWRVSGLITRQVLSKSISTKYHEKIERERKLIEKLKEEIKLNPLYPTIKNEGKKLDKYGLPRLKSWGNLLKDSRLKESYFVKLYGLYSSFAHSEYLAVMQINEGNWNINNELNITNAETSLIAIQMLNSVTILLLKQKFSNLDVYYNEFDNNLKVRIEFWNGIATQSSNFNLYV